MCLTTVDQELNSTNLTHLNGRLSELFPHPCYDGNNCDLIIKAVAIQAEDGVHLMLHSTERGFMF
jgi:hypothetical protein